MPLEIIVIGLIVLGSLVLWIVALVDVVRRQFPDPNTKIIWLLVILLAHGIGAIIYFAVGTKQGNLPGREWERW